MSTNIKIIQCKGKLERLGYGSGSYFQVIFDHELGSNYCYLELKSDIEFEGRTVKGIYIYSDLQSYIKDKKSWFNDKTNLTISFDKWKWSEDGSLSIGGENLEIKKKGSSSHSATATVDSGNTLWLEEETNHHGTEAENSSGDNVKPEANISESVDSEKVARIIADFNQANSIVNSNDVKDVSKMKASLKKLEQIKNNDSLERQEAFNTCPEGLFDEVISDLKGKVASLELANQQSSSSQPDQPTQLSQAEILASIQRENEAKKDDIDNKLNQAESENATKEEVAEAVKGSASNFGDENFQEQQKRQEVLEEKLAVEDFELYFKTMIEKVRLCLKENKLKETDLKLTNELRNQWTRLNRKVISDKDQVKVIIQQMQEQIIRQANEKELNSIHERVEKNKKKLLPENERKKLKDDIVKYLEKTKTNAYTKSNASKGEALLREFNSYSEPKITKPNEFPWVPVSLGIGAVGILAVAVLIIKKRKPRSR